MRTLYLIRGVPGSGKSTFAQNLKKAGLVAAVFEADQFFINGKGEYEFDPRLLHQAHTHCQDRTALYLKGNISVAVANTSTTEKEVEVYRKIAEETGSKFVSVIVENRHDGKNVHNVPEDKLLQMKRRFSIQL